MPRHPLRTILLAFALALPITVTVPAQTPLGTAFTYQGRLDDNGQPANAPYDLRFRLFDAPTGGNTLGSQVDLAGVPVTAGLFTVSIDFGAAAPVFTGEARWLEIAVRPAGGGSYSTLAPRQELTPSPHAIFSSTTPWAGIAGKPAGFADDVDNDTTYSAGAGLDLAGTVFSLADLGVTTAKLADQSVTSPKIANGAVGLAQINTAQVQARVAGSCALGSYLRGINPDGTAVCELLPIPPLLTNVDSSPGAFMGWRTSIAIGSDGLPVISHGDWVTGALRVTKCGNAGCTAGNTSTTVDDSPGGSMTDIFTSIAIGSDGLPVIGYFVLVAPAGLSVAKCGNPACTAGNTVSIVESNPGKGAFPSIAVGSDGLPVISYLDLSAGALIVAKCGDAGCVSGNVITMVDAPPSGNVVGVSTSIAIGLDGLPVISYSDATAGALKVAKCGDAGCTAGNVITTVDDPPGSNGYGSTSIAIGTDGHPVIAEVDGQTGPLSVVRCGNAACSTGNTITLVDPTAAHPSIAIGSDGLPVVSYGDATAGGLKMAKCGDAGCTAGNTISRVDPSADAGGFTSIAIGSDGLPVISYNAGQALKVAKCGNSACR